MGRDKLLLEYRDKSFLQQSVDLLSELPVSERVLITTEARAARIALPSGVRAVINDAPAKGQSYSIRLGIEASDCAHYLFLTADQPGLRSADLTPLLEAAGSYPDKIIYPVIDAKPGAPAIFPRRFRPELLALAGDTGGRIVRESNPDACYAIKPAQPQNFMDIDTVEDYNDFIDSKRTKCPMPR